MDWHPPAEPITVPAAPTDATRPELNYSSVLAPLGLAGVLIVATGNLQFALCACFSPLLATALWLENRRRVGKKNAAARRGHDIVLQSLRDEVRAADTARLRLRGLDPAEVLRRAALPSVRLWERRPPHEDYLALSVGVVDLPWRPPRPPGSPALPEELAHLPE